MLKKSFRLSIPASVLKANAASNTEFLPLVSLAYEDVPIWNILPSYQLYELTFLKNIDAEAENFATEPPNYEVASTSGSENNSGSYFPEMTRLTLLSDSNSSTEEVTDFPPVRLPVGSLSTSFSTWENSILAKAHLLGHLGDIDKIKAERIQIQLFLTIGPGSCGREQPTYDPLNKEFRQGDKIHGYVLLENYNKVPVPFEMFLVLFEGRVSVNSMESDSRLKPVVFYKFLNMFDYSASWTPAYFNGVDSKTDPRDGTSVQFNVKALEPGIRYKRFFNFTVPDRLLDCSCESHQIPRHCQLPPSFGLDRKMFLQRLRQQRDGHLSPKKSGSAPGLYIHPNQLPSGEHIARRPPLAPIVRDFCFLDTSISYCVEARLVGKRSKYQKSCLPGSDEFIIVKENSVPVRVVPEEIGLLPEEDALIDRRFEGFCADVERVISRGNRLDSVATAPPTRRPSTVKQVYGSNNAADRNISGNFEVLMPYKKKSLTQTPKVVGMLLACFSREERIVRYNSPANFIPLSGSVKASPSLFVLPVSLEYCSREDLKSQRPPEIKGVMAKIVACTIRSHKYRIPVEFSQKLKFDNSLVLKDEFEKNVVEKFAKYLQELSQLIAKHGYTKLQANRQLMMDVKCLANLQVKNDCLKIGAEYTGRLPKWSYADSTGTCHNLFEVKVNFSAFSSDETLKQLPENMRGSLALVPSFESCIVARFYYALVELKLANGDTLPLKVPVKVQP